MEELFVENFFRRHQHERPIAQDLDRNFHKETINVEDPVNTFNLSIQNNDQKIYQKNSGVMLDLGIFLSRLENEIEREYADFADYRFIFNRIRAAFKQNSVEGVIEQLDNLEELLDLGLPSLIIKKNLV